MRQILTGLLIAQAIICTAQIPVPLTSAEDRFLIFHNGRFEDMEPRPPAFVHAMQGQVVYTDHQGQLKVFLPEGRRLHLLDHGSFSEPKGTRARIAWLQGDTLKSIREGRVAILAEHIVEFGVSDSLVVMLDSTLHRLEVLWRGKRITLATVDQGSERPQWVQGANTVVFFNKLQRKLYLFYRGEVKVLCDGTDAGIAVAGGDVVGYWHGDQQTFNAFYNGEQVPLSELRPVSAQAGAGLLAFVDANGGLKCFERGLLHAVSGETPSAYWVKDSLLLFLDQGCLKVFKDGITITVEPYVPERWQVDGNMLAYLDLNRELRGVGGGERFRFGNEANIASFDLFGKAVAYRSPLGQLVVATRRRSYIY